MSFDELVDAILCEQDSVTHYNEEGADVPMRLHQKYRQEAVESLRDWVKAQVAAEREQCCRDVCDGCAQGVPLEFTGRPDGGPKSTPIWIHLWGNGVWTVCGARAIHTRGGEG